jgi:hypothetical protein
MILKKRNHFAKEESNLVITPLTPSRKLEYNIKGLLYLVLSRL